MKFLKLWTKRKEIRELQLRVDHCRSTIAEVHRALLMGEVQPETAEQFRQLEASLEQVDVTRLRNRDLQEIEMATNKLLGEYCSLYGQGKLKNIYDGLLH